MTAASIAPIATERLILRMLNRSDAAALHSFRGDPDATRFLSHQPLTPEQNLVRLEETLERAAASTSEWFHYGWAITLRHPGTLQDPGEVIGDARTWNSSASPIAGVMPPGNLPFQQASLGYILHPRYQGRGYGREAAAALVHWLFRERSIQTVFAGVYEPNIASITLLRRLGFTQDRYIPAELDNFGKNLPSLRFRLDNVHVSSC